MFSIFMTTLVPAANADIASAAAARIVLRNVSRLEGTQDASAAFLVSDIRPSYGVVWNREVIATIAPDPINKLLQRMRSSSLPQKEYDRLVSFFKKAFCASVSFTADLFDWEILVGRFRPESSFDWALCSPPATSSRMRGLPLPRSWI